MIRNVILDIGQVLADFRWKEYIDSLCLDDMVAKKLIQETVLHNERWHKHDRGELSDEEFVQVCSAVDPDIEEAVRVFFANIADIVEEYDYAEDFVKILKKQGYHVYLLSNYGESTFRIAMDKFKFIQHVDGMVISSHIHSVKPEPEIYQALLKKYGLNPEECLFLDDKEENLQAAKAFGIHCIQFHSLEQAKTELEGYGILLYKKARSLFSH